MRRSFALLSMSASGVSRRRGLGPTHRIPAAPDAAATAAAEARAGTPTDRTPAAASAAAEAPAAAAAEGGLGTLAGCWLAPARRGGWLLHLLLLLRGWRLYARLRRHLSVIRHRVVRVNAPHVRHGFHAIPLRGCVRAQHRGGTPPPPPPPRALDDPPFTPADTIPPPAFASDSFFFFDPPALLSVGLRLVSLDFPPPNPSRLRSAEASIIMSFSFAAFFFSSFSSCAGLAPPRPRSRFLPSRCGRHNRGDAPDWFMPCTSSLTSCCTGVGCICCTCEGYCD